MEMMYERGKKCVNPPLLFLFIVIKYNHNKERGGLVWLMQ